MDLNQKYPPSPACSCDTCLSYCRRPGWWTVEEAAAALQAGFGNRMMLEMSPDMTFGVLSPAFKGCEMNFAINEFAKNACTFLADGKCKLHGSPHMPLECRFCHHDRAGKGNDCHLDLENDWKTPAGQELVVAWGNETGLWKKLDAFLASRK